MFENWVVAMVSQLNQFTLKNHWITYMKKDLGGAATSAGPSDLYLYQKLFFANAAF